ncbi:MAG: phage holin family protein [Actinomycetes bacterium]
MTDDRPSLGTLVAGITAEISALVRGEIALAKAEVRESAKAGATGAILFVIAGVLVGMVWLLATWAVVYVLVEVADLPTWASFLIVAGVYLLIAIILGAVGVFRLKKARGPELAKAEMERTKQIIESLPPNTPPVPAQVRNPHAANGASKA